MLRKYLFIHIYFSSAVLRMRAMSTRLLFYLDLVLQGEHIDRTDKIYCK